MVLSEEIQEFLISVLCTLIGLGVLGVIGALCWWATVSESMFNILSLAGLMGIGVGLLVALLLAFLKITEPKE